MQPPQAFEPFPALHVVGGEEELALGGPGPGRRREGAAVEEIPGVGPQVFEDLPLKTATSVG